jgi:L-2-hydroxyglutarate oxidase LhgO
LKRTYLYSVKHLIIGGGVIGLSTVLSLIPYI